ncbi:hypothetical protein PCE1_004848 [Barthelona sp. PCE]
MHASALNYTFIDQSALEILSKLDHFAFLFLTYLSLLMYGQPTNQGYAQPGYGNPQMGMMQPAPQMMAQPQPGYGAPMGQQPMAQPMQPMGGQQAYWGRFKQSKKAKGSACGCCCCIIVIILIIVFVGSSSKILQCQNAKTINTPSWTALDNTVNGIWLDGNAVDVKVTVGTTNRYKMYVKSTKNSTLAELLTTTTTTKSFHGASVTNVLTFTGTDSTQDIYTDCTVLGLELQLTSSRVLDLFHVNGKSFFDAFSGNNNGEVTGLATTYLHIDVEKNTFKGDDMMFDNIDNDGTSVVFKDLDVSGMAASPTKAYSKTTFGSQVFGFSATPANSLLSLETTTGALVTSWKTTASGAVKTKKTLKTTRSGYGSKTSEMGESYASGDYTMYPIYSAGNISTSNFIVQADASFLGSVYAVGAPSA